MFWRNVKPVFLVYTFIVKLISCFVNYTVISNIHNRTPKSGILFTDICIGDFFNIQDFMKHWVEVIFYYYYLWTKIEPNRKYEWLQAKRSESAESSLAERIEALSTIYSWTIRIMCHVKFFVPRWGFLIRCAILVYDENDVDLEW